MCEKQNVATPEKQLLQWRSVAYRAHVEAKKIKSMLLNDHKLSRQGQGVSPVRSTTGSFTTFGTSLQRNQAFTTFGQQHQQRRQQQAGQTSQAFTIFGQNNRQAVAPSPPSTGSFTSFGPSSQPTRGNQGVSFTTFGPVGSPPASALGSFFGGRQSTFGGLQPSLGRSFAGRQQPVSQNQVNPSPNSFINFG